MEENMTNKFKNAMVLAVLALVLLSPVSAAKKKKNDAFKKIEKQKDPATKKVYDFKGMTIVLGDWWTDPSAGRSDRRPGRCPD